uniref:Aromatic-L-amino-acid decarboxylase n=1 Tax=Chromera velia CCMP2878 TaxID=1169474 RepID=A0A0G4HDF4_9ALVE|eukprot:Cvel_26348.t1-p1 / transcript=Cvel_26348.t1 / gene=Cvel_26348 / organism=Chromera_velia_CCMP2878 / gene_product=Tyrosine decarboxylase 1, putative / transcript_product=Tyrosine decarboxylase 1, putative / location=Cvel_scaffold3120:1800-6401(-) / protein_length=532 / sequence_SO=supercontig / SO=protein_coding / is_pseudo=false
MSAPTEGERLRKEMKQRIADYRKNAHALVDYVADYYEMLADASTDIPVLSRVSPGFITQNPKFTQPPPAEGVSFESVLKEVEEVIKPGMTHWQHPHFMAYFPSATSLESQLGDMLAQAFNAVGFSWITSPAMTELEMVTLDWIAKAMDLPEKFLSSGAGGGCIQMTASDACFVVILGARERAVRSEAFLPYPKKTLENGHANGHAKEASQVLEQEEDEAKRTDFSKLVAYVTDQAHSALAKSAKCAGVRCRVLPTRGGAEGGFLGMDVDALLEEMRKDRDAGRIPCFVNATVGTTSTNAVDSMSTLAAAVRKEFPSVWLHCDAAYAGAFNLLPECREHFKGLEDFDSFNFNPHKQMLVGFDCSVLYIGRKEDVVSVFQATPEFLKNKHTSSGTVIDYKDWQVGLGRRFRSLKIFFVWKLLGRAKVEEYLRRCLSSAKVFSDLITSDPSKSFEVTHPVKFGLVCFRLRDASDEVQLKLLERLNHSPRNLFLIHTKVEGRVVLRAAFNTPLGGEEQAHTLWEALKEEMVSLSKS